jgi:hypothetical protein
MYIATSDSDLSLYFDKSVKYLNRDKKFLSCKTYIVTLQLDASSYRFTGYLSTSTGYIIHQVLPGGVRSMVATNKENLYL